MKKKATVVNFTGDFKDLIPDGWGFNKLFARNYRCYSKFIELEYGERMWIWQHKGGYVEYKDLFSMTHVLFKVILSGEYKEFKHLSDYYCFVVDRENYSYVKHDRKKHESLHQFMAMEDGKITGSEYDNFIHWMQHDVKKILFSKIDVDFVLDMAKKGYIDPKNLTKEI